MKRLILTTLFLLVFLLGAAAAHLYWFAHAPLGQAGTKQSFTVNSGSGLASISRQLTEQGLLPDRWRFTLIARLSGRAGSLKAGIYQIDPNSSPLQLLEQFNKGETAEIPLTLIEGWTVQQVRDTLASNPDVKQDLPAVGTAELGGALGLAQSHAEGLFFPDTYHVARGGSASALLKRSAQRMAQKLQEEWDQRAPDLPYKTPYEALIMASIVEKETGLASDRTMIAAVFVNRLRLGMRLQTDPSVIYGIGPSFNGNLTKAQLQQDTPYNSYTRAGLPPTPIALPGLASLHAALHPAKSKALYFVARGDGSSVFSETLTEHNRAVNQYQK